ncbi:MAG: hypothetical protein HXY51_04320 [Nitrospirae bacterium]|nr:hypothetical protein [Nitrospirota bacterium]
MDKPMYGTGIGYRSRNDEFSNDEARYKERDDADAESCHTNVKRIDAGPSELDSAV